MKTVEFRLTEKPVINPYRGWITYGLAEPFEFIMDRVSVGYTRFCWKDIEPAEGCYNWEPIEKFLNSYAKYGKQASFGILYMSSGSKEDLFPDYLKHCGIDMREIQYYENIGMVEKIALTPCHDDPIFFAKLSKFMQAVAEKYDGDPRVAYIDIRSLGNWGEGHSILFRRPEFRRETVRMHYQMHRDLFHKTDIVMPWGEEQYQEIYEEFVEKGFGLRRDGLMGNATGTEIFPAMGKAPGVFEFWGGYELTCHYNWFDGGKTEVFDYGKDPSEASDLAYYFPKEARSWWPKGNEVHAWHCGGNGYQDSILLGRPTHIPLCGAHDCKLMWEERRPFIERWTNEVGYAFLMEAACFDEEPQDGVLRVRAMWKNHGISMLYKPACPVVVLVDSEGRVAASKTVANLNFAKVMPRLYREMDTYLPVDGVPAGEYDLYIGVGKPGETFLPGQPLPEAFIQTVSEGTHRNRWLFLSHLSWK